MPLNSDGSLRPYDDDEIEAFQLETRGFRDATHPTERAELDTVTVERKWFCNWFERWNVVDYLLGASVLYTTGGDTFLSRLLPQAIPGRDRIVATKVTQMHGHEPIGNDDDGMPFYSKAELTVLFEFVPFMLIPDGDIEGDEMRRFVTYPASVENSGEFLMLPANSGLKYVANASQAGSSVNGRSIPTNQTAVVQPSEAFTAVWHMLPENTYAVGSNLFNRIYGTSEWLGGDDIPFQGCINSEVIFGRPGGTVLFQRVKPIRQVNPQGTGWWWRLEYEFVYKPSGWNYLYANSTTPGENGYYYVSSDGSTHAADATPDFTSLYNCRDLRELFSVSS